MDKFRVRTGDIDMEVKAINTRMAAMKAIEKSPSASLGVLIEIKKVGDWEGNTLYCKTEFVLGLMGLELLED